MIFFLLWVCNKVLGPLLFSLLLARFFKTIEVPDDILLHLWYLDDGCMVGSRSGIAHFLSQMQENGPPLGLHLNLEKCEVFWPSGDSSFPDFPTEISRVKNGVSLLESPVWGRTGYTIDFVSAIVHKASALQQLLGGQEDPQVELHLLRSCLSTCKLSDILQTVPPGDIDICLKQFDSNPPALWHLRCPISTRPGCKRPFH